MLNICEPLNLNLNTAWIVQLVNRRGHWDTPTQHGQRCSLSYLRVQIADFSLSKVSTKKYPYSPPEGIGISWGVGGSVRPKYLMKCVKLYWNFQRGGGRGLRKKNPSLPWRRYGYKWNYMYTMNTTAFIWRKTMLRYLSAGIICSKKCPVFQEHSQTKTVSFGEQRTGQISKHYFHATWGYCVNCSSNIFCNTCCFENLEITHGYFPVLAGEYSGNYQATGSLKERFGSARN